MSYRQKVYLLGHANTGKTSLYNRLTGANEKVANYHGATTRLSQKNLRGHKDTLLYDLPGTYSISGKSEDEVLTVETIKKSDENSLLLFVLDGVNLKKNIENLIPFLESFDNKKQRIAFVINMIDEVDYNNIEIDKLKIQRELDIPLVLTSAKKNTGIKKLRDLIVGAKDLRPLDLKDFSSRLSKLENYTKHQGLISYRRMQSIDRVLLSPLWGPLFFIFIMTVLFQAVFSWAAPFMDLIDSGVSNLSSLITPYFSNIYVKSFFKDALFGGLGAFLVFTPQIFFLKFIISLLEESGYLSRSSILCHRLLSFFGLSGESFIPLLTSHACAIPGIYAAKHIRSKKTWFITIISLPLTLCSARLPVYALLIAFLVPNTLYFSGLVGLRGFVLFSLYLFGLFLTLIVSKVLSLALHKKNKKALLAIELPRYQIPCISDVIKQSFQTTYTFIRDAGFVIFSTNCFIWALATFPNGPGNLTSSFLSALGKFLKPISSPIGLDWPETVALLTSFLARETFVSTLGTLYGSNSDSVKALADIIREQQGGYTLASTLSLLTFFAIALQCISTLAVLRRELKSDKIAFTLFLSYLIFAYIASFIVYNLTSFLL